MRREFLAWTGVVAALLTIGSSLLATAVSPGFRWRENALSNLGVSSTEVGTTLTVVLFNGGLIAGGLVGLLFCWVLYSHAPTRPARFVAGLLAVTVGLMGLVGVFPQGTTLHVPVAAGFFLLITGTLWTDGVVWLRNGDRQWALISTIAGTANIATWIVWVAAGTPWGLAVPEIIGAVIFGAWVSLRSADLARKR